MIKKLTLLLFLLPTFSANATLLTFEDIPGGSNPYNFGGMPVYKGFNFSPPLVWIDVGTAGSVVPPEPPTPWLYGAHSGEFSIFNDDRFAGTGIITEAGGAISLLTVYGQKNGVPTQIREALILCLVHYPVTTMVVKSGR